MRLRDAYSILAYLNTYYNTRTHCSVYSFIVGALKKAKPHRVVTLKNIVNIKINFTIDHGPHWPISAL